MIRVAFDIPAWVGPASALIVGVAVGFVLGFGFAVWVSRSGARF